MAYAKLTRWTIYRNRSHVRVVHLSSVLLEPPNSNSPIVCTPGDGRMRRISGSFSASLPKPRQAYSHNEKAFSIRVNYKDAPPDEEEGVCEEATEVPGLHEGAEVVEGDAAGLGHDHGRSRRLVDHAVANSPTDVRPGRHVATHPLQSPTSTFNCTHSITEPTYTSSERPLSAAPSGSR